MGSGIPLTGEFTATRNTHAVIQTTEYEEAAT